LHGFIIIRRLIPGLDIDLHGFIIIRRLIPGLDIDLYEFIIIRRLIPGLDKLAEKMEMHVSDTLVQNCPHAESEIARRKEAKKKGFELIAEVGTVTVYRCAERGKEEGIRADCGGRKFFKFHPL
jgi:hypothetical protein